MRRIFSQNPQLYTYAEVYCKNVLPKLFMIRLQLGALASARRANIYLCKTTLLGLRPLSQFWSIRCMSHGHHFNKTTKELQANLQVLQDSQMSADSQRTWMAHRLSSHRQSRTISCFVLCREAASSFDAYKLLLRISKAYLKRSKRSGRVIWLILVEGLSESGTWNVLPCDLFLSFLMPSWNSQFDSRMHVDDLRNEYQILQTISHRFLSTRASWHAMSVDLRPPLYGDHKTVAPPLCVAPNCSRNVLPAHPITLERGH